MTRPDWWPSWIPDRDAEGHEMAEGISLTWRNCDCPASGSSNGHHVAYCRINGCMAAPAKPPGCDRDVAPR